MRNPFFAFAAVLIATGFASSAVGAPDLFPAVLTNNAIGDQAAIPTDVSYTAEPPYDNPADKSGRRLLDRDRPWDDWNVTVGINKPEQTVVFDFDDAYRFSIFSLRMPGEQRPAVVDIAVSADQEGPWTDVASLVPAEMQPDDRGWFRRSLDEPVEGRYVRMRFRIKEWGWYLKEVRLWGVRADEPPPHARLPLVMDGDRPVIARHGEPCAAIVLAGDAPSDTVAAARYLQTMVRQMTGATLPLRDDSHDRGGGRVLIGPSALNDPGIAQGMDAPQGYRLRVHGRTISLVGNDAGPLQGTKHAVHALLREFGCGWFGPSELYQVAPSVDELSIGPMDREEHPDFDYRHVWNVPADGRNAWGLGGPRMQFGHAYRRLLPPDQYYEDHPEYYALVDGERVHKNAQICFANEDVRRIVVEAARDYFDEHPDALVFSLSANDCGGFCECSACAKMGSSPGEQSLAFANAVGRELAKTHPRKLVCFLAYWYTFAAPRDMQAEPNVMVMVVNQACHAHAVDDPDCPHNVGWRENFEKWATTGAKMAIYEWYIPGCGQKHWRTLPWASTDVAFANLRYWRSQGVRWVTYESQSAYENGDGYPRRWPLYFMAARGLRDCDADPNTVLREACETLYGPAGEAMARYFRTMADAMRQTRVHGSIWNLPDAKAIYRPEVRARLRALLAEALEAAMEDIPAWERVLEEATLWRESERTLRDLPELKHYAVDAREYNGGVWFTDRAEVTGAFLRDIVGIGAGEALEVVIEDRRAPLEDERTYETTAGVRLVPNG